MLLPPFPEPVAPLQDAQEIERPEATPPAPPEAPLPIPVEHWSPNGGFLKTTCAICGVLFIAEYHAGQRPPFYCALHLPAFPPPSANVPFLMPVTAPEPSRQQVASFSAADPKAIVGMIDVLLRRSRLSKAEVARRMGIKDQSLQQYWSLRRGATRGVTLRWFARLVEATGGRLLIEFPPDIDA